MNTSEQIQTSTPSKKPYAKPEIVYKQLLEAMAAVCTGSPVKTSAGAGCDTLGLFS